MNEDIEKRFHEDMLALYDKIGRSTGYWPHYFRRKVRNRGGLAAAKSWLNDAKSVSEGFKRLRDLGRLDFSMEALILQEPWSKLFTEAERHIAQTRLDLHGYRVA